MSRRKPRGMYVSDWVLREEFDPCIYSKQTYLLCKVQWAKSERFWIHWVRNDNDKDCHAEKYFLEEVFELRSSRICYITWYLSWSPCATCCYIIRNFLERHPNVHIDIRVARLYEVHQPRTCRGLRVLARLRGRVTIDVMKIKDYGYCSKTFIKGDDNVFLPMEFIPAINRNRWMLKNILEGSYI
ncbi:C-_U-editing enzyme APOBEC-1-like [Aphelocoma coerulescens]|uniref:C->U-editing enzyme APOBEC-1-like n=1 Tax=Aphelocoma coerulescens TaxID=39617 RepID=UPI00360460AE